MTRIAFISGHLDLTVGEFADYYAPKIDHALRKGHSFVFGDARGADALAGIYLKEKQRSNPKIKVNLYHMFETPRNNEGFPLVGGFQTDQARDEAMTLASCYDIAWVRKGRETSGTQRNINRREKLINQKGILEQGIKLKDLNKRLRKYDYAWFVCKHKGSNRKRVLYGYFGGMSIYLRIGNEDKRSVETDFLPIAFFIEEDIPDLEVPDFIKESHDG